MNKSIVALMVLSLLAVAAGCGGNNEAKIQGDASWMGGAPLSVERSTALSELVVQPASFVGKTILLEGKVTGVCKGMGCWVEVADEQGHSFIAKSLDHSITFPKDCEGQKVRVEGIIITQPAQAEEPEHASEGQPHECPAPVYMMELKGAKLL